MINILHRYTKTILYHSETAQTIAEAVVEAVKKDADLQGAHLRGAHLQGAHLQGAHLRGADLRDADLQGAHLQGAHLRGADLRDADLLDAYLQGAHLRGAHLQDAKGYVNSHDFFVECIRRLPIEGFAPAEWAAIGQIVVHRPCWGELFVQYADVAPHVLDVLAEAGFTEWRDHWLTLTKDKQP